MTRQHMRYRALTEAARMARELADSEALEFYAERLIEQQWLKEELRGVARRLEAQAAGMAL